MKIIEGNVEEHAEDIQEIFSEYLHWRNGEVDRNFGISFDINSILKEDINNFLPPEGRLLLADNQGILMGIGCLKKLENDIGEIKRMYVRSEYRRQGAAKALLKRLIAEAVKIGYSKIRLSSAKFMKAAHAMYRSHGFQEIAPYQDSEIPEESQSNWIFMEKLLDS